MCFVLPVPAAAPELAAGSFRSINADDNWRQVEIYWQVNAHTSVASYECMLQESSALG